MFKSTDLLAHESAARRRVEVAHQQLHILLQLSSPVQEVGKALDG